MRKSLHKLTYFVLKIPSIIILATHDQIKKQQGNQKETIRFPLPPQHTLQEEQNLLEF